MAGGLRRGVAVVSASKTLISGLPGRDNADGGRTNLLADETALPRFPNTDAPAITSSVPESPLSLSLSIKSRELIHYKNKHPFIMHSPPPPPIRRAPAASSRP